MKKNFIPIFSSIFLVLGCGALAASVFLGTSTSSFLKEATMVSGKIVRVERRRDSHNANMYAPVVSFQTPDGQKHEFTGQVWTSSRSWNEGQSLAVLYRPSDPSDARLDSFFQLWFGVLLTGFIGLVFGAVGGTLLFKQILRKKEIAWLRQNGATIQGKVVSVGLNASVRIQGRCPFVIECQWTDPRSGKVYVSLSDDLWFNPIQSGHVQVGEELQIYYNARDPKRSWVDIARFENMAA